MSVFARTVVIDEIPSVSKEKQQKLENVLRKLFSNLNSGMEFHFPYDESVQKHKNYCFVKFESEEAAMTAIKVGDGYPLDKTHTLRLNKFTDIEVYANMSEEYQEPEIPAYQEKGYFRYWLNDPKSRDQFATVQADGVSVLWNNKHLAPDTEHARKNWSEAYVQWSPQGSYLVTIHKQGIALWGTQEWSKIVRFPHQDVKFIDFSKDEKYMTTYSIQSFQEGDKVYNLSVWEVQSGKKLRSFPVDSSSFSATTTGSKTLNVPWPMFKFSPSGKYIARHVTGVNGAIFIYELPSMNLLEKKSIKVENCMDFTWAPNKDVIVYWTPENGNVPARVCAMKIPSREIIRTKNLFGVSSLTFHWQNNGDYLLCHVTRTKTKKFVNTFEIFRFGEKDIPIDVFEYSPSVSSLAWEPSGKKFTVLSLENNKSTFDLFEMVQEKNSPVSIKQIASTEKKSSFNTISWCPKGRYLVLAGLKTTGELEFWDMNDFSMMGSSEHYLCTELDWDVSGRYLTSIVSYWKVTSDTGYTVWTFTGQKLYSTVTPVFKQFLWRPRPATLLSEEKQKEVKKNIKKYSSGFDQEDMNADNQVTKDVLEKRREEYREWMELEKKWSQFREEKKEVREKIWGVLPEKIVESLFEIIEEEEIVDN